jgi:hypothetical protein
LQNEQTKHQFSFADHGNQKMKKNNKTSMQFHFKISILAKPQNISVSFFNMILRENKFIGT